MKFSGILIASMLSLAVPAFGQDRSGFDHRVPHSPPGVAESTHYGWADVLRVDPIYDPGEVETPPHQECFDEQAPPPPAHADTRAGGTVVGAIIGGVIGNLFGRGEGRKATTAVGAVAGGVVGNNIASANDARADAATPSSERHCREVPAQGRIVAYDVEYRYRGEIYMARLAYDPGDRLRVRVSVMPAE
ncbi:MAG: glycine zipper 2TM domain-containing protein [Rudaea sp.]